MRNEDYDYKDHSRLLYVGGALVLLIAGFMLGMFWTQMNNPMMKQAEFRQLSTVYNKIMDDYLNGADSTELLQGAMQGMVATLKDPYSQYLPEEKGQAYKQSYEGQFYGIGAMLRQEGERFIINEVIKDAPAERGGLQAEDVVIAVDGQELKGKTLQELLSMVRGEKGTSVTLKISRTGETQPLEITLERDEIPVHTVASERLEDGIGHVTISRFAENTAEEFEAALVTLQEEEPLKGLLLDLRSNPGGLLGPTTQIANRLIPNGEKILDVVYKNERKVVSFLSEHTESWDVPVVVLVNGQSASASEVLAAALKESAGAQIVGETTYGKGVVQIFQQFPDGSVLSLTEAQWKTPGGTWINEQGVAPSVEVSLPEYASLRPLSTGAEMKRGSYGEDVKTLQKMLATLGYEAGAGASEGIFDDRTEGALREFQVAESLEATGQFNDQTGRRLVELLREKLRSEDTQLSKGIELLRQPQ